MSNMRDSKVERKLLPYGGVMRRRLLGAGVAGLANTLLSSSLISGALAADQAQRNRKPGERILLKGGAVLTMDRTLVYRFIKVFTIKPWADQSSSTGSGQDEHSFPRHLEGCAA